MEYKTSLMLIIAAGIMNGSFVIPMRYIKNISSEVVWLFHSIIGLGIIPWLILFITMPGIAAHYSELQTSDLLFLLVSGAIFGIGQVCFAYAIETLGIALSFIINLGLGVTIGSMFVVFYKSAFFSTQGYLVTLAVALIVASLIINYFAGKNNQGRHQSILMPGQHYHIGWWLAAFTGLTSGLQNIAFVIVAFHSTTVFKADNAFWVWPPFLLAAAFPMLIGFIYRLNKYRQTANIFAFLSLKNLLLVGIMGLFFTGSLALYSGGMSKLTHQQQIIGWPAFMVSIILASQIWGWIHNETKAATAKSKTYLICGIILLILAILILSLEI